ncbi:hypothetical protein MPNT_10243 [Candidatus Methylacidithermus pantelleriae]|uniref:Uncharacterized protein n=1 Tax=Candidatus Methylacidithermus pantelleriae TaxID=2744239 RepID=A0A8J2FRM7_9BACT|nr:hypothetical protein MPNT_10243 [Candidatus Methylacidithermus pantelleriae]
MVDLKETTRDIVRDLLEVNVLMCARLYGRRGILAGTKRRDRWERFLVKSSPFSPMRYGSS